MSNPQPDRLKPPPRRAEPLQPDSPGKGNSTTPPTDEHSAELARESARKQKEQNDTAHENVRKGYD